MLLRARSRLLLFFGAIPALSQAQNTDNKELDSLSIEQLLNVRVQTPTLRKQSLQDAPASVTVLTAEMIRRYGFRTLGEALANVRSFYVSSDGAFTSAGARGFNLLGDYNTRFLVLINGHQLTDNVYGSMYYFDEDFPLDMDLVEQIEVVRGPSSALYGSNGVFATVNIITKSPAGEPGERASVRVGSFGDRKVTATSSVGLGGGAHALFSASASYSNGRTASFPELSAGGLPLSRTDHVGAGDGYHLFADVRWKDWSVVALFGQHRALAPTGWYKTEFGNTGTTDLEARNFIEATWNHALGQTGALRWRTYYDQFRYDGVYDYGSGPRNLDGALGDWVGSQLVYTRETGKLGTLTVGGEVNADLRNLQYNIDVDDAGDGPVRHEVFRISHLRRSYGIFAQQDFVLSPTWTAYVGARLDETNFDKVALSPRVALMHRRGATMYKLMYGRAFRNPSTYERYWEPNPALGAEHVQTVEAVREQNLGRGVNLVTSVFRYQLGGLIVGVPVRPDTLQYQNASSASAFGFEMEASGQPTHWLSTAASYSAQRTRGLDRQRQLENSPVQIGQFRASVPVARQRLWLGGAVRCLSSRLDSAGERVAGTAFVDLTATAPRLHPQFEFQFGIRNLLNTSAADPLSPEHLTRTIPLAGRSVFVKLIWHHE